MADTPRYYWDSCVWIGLINEELDKIEACKHVLALAESGKAEIWTSTYSLAEVFKKKCDGANVGIGHDQDVLFENFLSSDYLIYAQVDVDIGTYARRLLRKYPILAKPPDAVHLATALLNNLDEMHTFDNANLLGLDGLLNRRDGKKLKICKPPVPDQASLPLPIGKTTATPAAVNETTLERSVEVNGPPIASMVPQREEKSDTKPAPSTQNNEVSIDAPQANERS